MPEPERDAFGMPIVPDGAATLPSPEVAAEPSGSPESLVAPPRSGAAPGAGAARALRWLFCLLCLAGTALVVWHADREALDAPEVIARDLGGHGLADVSLVREANLRRALAALRAELRPGEVALSLRVEPSVVRVQARDPNGAARLLDADLGLDVHGRDWGTDTSSAVLDLARVDPAVPERIAREALRSAGADDTHLGALTLTGSEGTAPTWHVSLDDVRIADQGWTADLDGVAVTRPGELPAASGVGGASLLAPANLARALARVARHGSRVSSLRIEPQRLDATVAGGGRAVDVQVDAALRMTDRETTAAPSARVPLAAIDVEAPRRAVLAAARRGGFPPERIDYLVLALAPPSSGLADGWTLFFEDVPPRRAAWRATTDGRVSPL